MCTQHYLKSNKIKSGDRVAAYLPNIIETVEYFIGTAAIGAIWSSCSPDFGTNGVLDRFSQIKPKVISIDGSKEVMLISNFDMEEKISKIKF